MVGKYHHQRRFGCKVKDSKESSRRTHWMLAQLSGPHGASLVRALRPPFLCISPGWDVSMRFEELFLGELPLLGGERETLFPPVERATEQVTNL